MQIKSAFFNIQKNVFILNNQIVMCYNSNECGGMMVANNILELIGNTPLLKINTDNMSGDVYVKMERNNPSGSVKDRAVLGMYEHALANGKVDKDTIFVEATSGNTGIALAMIGGAYGHRVVLTMPESMSQERRDLLAAYGAEIILTPASEAMVGAEAKAVELVSENPNAVRLSQFENGGNPLKHYETTAREILADLPHIDAFVAGIGTGGTISGVSKYLKEIDSNIKTVGVEPFESPVITEGRKGPHKIQGIGAGFVPDNFHKQYVDEIRTLKTEDAFAETKSLVTSDGLFAGISAGSNILAAKKLAKELGVGSVVVTVLPDDGTKYLSMGVFE